MQANQLRLWFASMAYVLVESLRRRALQATELANATCGTIRRKLFKIGALVTVSVRRIKFAMASGCPYKAVFATAHRALAADTAERNCAAAASWPKRPLYGATHRHARHDAHAVHGPTADSPCASSVATASRPRRSAPSPPLPARISADREKQSVRYPG
jgi:hypothetical protein